MTRWTPHKIDEVVKTIIDDVIRDNGLVAGDIRNKASKFGLDLGMDELDLREVICRVETVFEIGLSDDLFTLNSDCGDLASWVRVRRTLLDKWSDFPEDK